MAKCGSNNNNNGTAQAEGRNITKAAAQTAAKAAALTKANADALAWGNSQTCPKSCPLKSKTVYKHGNPTEDSTVLVPINPKFLNGPTIWKSTYSVTWSASVSCDKFPFSNKERQSIAVVTKLLGEL